MTELIATSSFFFSCLTPFLFLLLLLLLFFWLMFHAIYVPSAAEPAVGLNPSIFVKKQGRRR
jgi:hypothetical protein